jgi:very-short-patch-repair endonuclease
VGQDLHQRTSRPATADHGRDGRPERPRRRRPGHGSSEAGRLIIAAADRADSAAERLLVKLLREAGITGWVLGYPFGHYRIDLAFPASKVAIEVDGWAWHVDAERFRNDRRKGNAIARERWDLLRFTWHDLDGRPGETGSKT